MSILFIDLTDGNGPARNAVESLQERYGENEVIILRVARLAKTFSRAILDNQAFAGLLPFLTLTGANLQAINSIIIAAHGTMVDVTHCYDDNFGTPGERLLTAEQLATFSNRIFQVLGLSHQQIANMTLLVCYAARTVDYRRDHIAEKNSVDFTQTFAYRFSSQLGRELQNPMPITVKAYTGYISFQDAKMGNGMSNPEAGYIFCETEERIALEDRLDEIEGEIANKKKWIKCLGTFCNYNACLPCNESLEHSYDQLTNERDNIIGMSSIKNHGCVVYTAMGNGVQYSTDVLKASAPATRRAAGQLSNT